MRFDCTGEALPPCLKALPSCLALKKREEKIEKGGEEKQNENDNSPDPNAEADLVNSNPAIQTKTDEDSANKT